jgi:hypothetical protein
MRNYIIITKEQADVIRGRHGKYSAIEPVLSPDGNYLVPERCLDDSDLSDVKNTIENMIQPANTNVQDIEDLPEVGLLVTKDKIYKYDNDDGFPPLVIARQDHTRMDFKPQDTPALFTFFRENSDTLEWIPNEKVDLGWKRMYNGVQYECIQAHMTLENWTPTATLGTLWKSLAPVTAEWTIGVAYKVNDIVTYQSKTYKCLQAHTSISTWNPVATINVLWKLQ